MPARRETCWYLHGEHQKGVFAQQNQEDIPMELCQEYMAVGHPMRRHTGIYFFDAEKLV